MIDKDISFILVQDKDNNLYKSSIAGLKNILIINSNDSERISKLESEIDETIEFLHQLSVDFIENHYSIEQLNEMFEQKTNTDYMKIDKTILSEKDISDKMLDRKLVLTDTVDNEYDKLDNEAINKFAELDTITNKWMN